MPRKSANVARKASETRVSQTLARVLRVAPAEDVGGVVTNYRDGNHAPLQPVLFREDPLMYAWEVNVAQCIMDPKMTPFVETLISMPGTWHVVKDTAHSGSDAIWLACADPHSSELASLYRQQFRGLIHCHILPGSQSAALVIGVQLSSCRP